MDNRYYDELAKCASSFEYFCNSYVKVNSPTKGLIPFILHDFQKRYISHLQGNRFSISTKFRQGGFSTLTTAYLLWKFLFHRDLNIMVLSRTDREAVVLGELFQRMHDLLPEWLHAVFETNNKHTKKSVETGCRIMFRTPEATIGCSVDILFIDEAAFIAKMDRQWKSMWPTIATKGRVIVISTVNSNSGWFYDVYQDASNGKNDFSVFRAEYTEHPDWDEEKINILKNNLGSIGFQQEMEQNFLPSGEMFICDKPEDEKEILNDMGSCTAHVPEWKDSDEMAPFRDKCEVDGDVFVDAKESVPDETYLDPVLERFNMLKGADIKDSNKPPQLLYECELKGECRDNEPEDVRNKMDAIDKIDLREKKGYSFKCADMNELAKMFPEITPDKISRVKHPHMNEEFDMSSKNLAEIFEGLAKHDEEFKDAAKYWRANYERHERKQEELESKIHGAFPADLLRLAGVISKKEEKEIEQSCSTGKVDILHSILEDGGFPKSLNLSFGDYLEVNGVPTLITTNSVKNVYMGLTALWDHERAVSFVSDILKEKLDILFGFGKVK